MSRKLLMTGGTGFLGIALRHRLEERGWVVTALSRSRSGQERGTTFVPFEAIAEIGLHEAVINLAGEPIVGVWTAEKRRAILRSRVETTHRMVSWIAQNPVSTFLSASGIDIYGDRGGEVLSERASISHGGFMARVAGAWEEAAMGAGCRTVLLRTSPVLSPDGGYLRTVLPIYRKFPILVLGPSDAWFSWIALNDWVELVCRALDDPGFEGPINLAAPHPVRQREFVAALADKLGKRVWGRVPRWLLRLAAGEFGDLLASSRRVVPSAALAAGFNFEFEDVGDFIERRL